MFSKHDFKLDIFVVLYRNYFKMHVSIVRSTVLVVDYSAVKVSILALSQYVVPNT